MQPLLRIQTIPIKIEAQTKRASLQQSAEPASAPAPRSRGNYRPAQVRTPAPQPQVKSEAQRVNPDQHQARAAQAQSTQSDNYLQEASNAIDAFKQSAVVGNVGNSEYTPNIPQDLEFEPQVPVIASGSGSTSFDYQMDRATYDWNASAKPQLEYIPPSIEYSVTQYPDVIIEYVGEPIYVPASSNPNYVPPPEEK